MNSGLVDRMARLSPEKQRLLLQAMAATRERSDAGIVVGQRREPPRASFAQQRLWFIAQLEPKSSAYNMAGAIRLRGRLDAGALQRTLQEIVRRHEVLRTSFVLDDDELLQVVAERASVPVRVFDLQGLAVAARDVTATQLAIDEGNTPFDLGRGPLLRAALLLMGDEDQVLLLTLHHIVADGWSVAILLREVTVLYEAFASGQSSPLPDLAAQYADFAEWQRRHLQGEVLERHLAYWRSHLGIEPVLDFPTDFPRPPVLSDAGAIHAQMIGPEVTSKIKELCRRERVTLFAALLAGIQTVLHCRTARPSVVVGTDIANRNRHETEGLIGFFINQLVLRTEFHGNPTLREVLARVRETVLGAYAHQDLPFDMLVKDLNPRRDLSRTPLFQVKLVVHNTPLQPLAFKGVTNAFFRAPRPKAKFEILINMQEAAAQISSVTIYNVDLFKAATIARLIGQIESTLAALADHPEMTVSQLTGVLEEADRRQHAGRQAVAHASLRRILRKDLPRGE
jgi:hypothetical protein